MFDEAKPPYQEALERSGYRHNLGYEAPQEFSTKKKNRKKRVTWFNPPYSLNVKTMNNPANRTKSKLSAHTWDLKDKGIDYDIEWKLLDRAPTYNPTTKKCRLCLKEKFYIMYRKDNSSLNKRSEVFNTCRNRTQGLLTNVKT